MKNNTILFYIIENEKIDVDKNISEVKRVYSDLVREFHVVYSRDYLSQVFNIIQNVDTVEVDKVIILTNHLIGPFYPLQEVFKKMNRVSCDFWTLTKAGKNITRDIEEHFQFYFCVFNKSFFMNANIRKCFSKGRYLNDEVAFSNLLMECGLHGETYVNTDNQERKTLDYRVDISVEAPCLLVKKYACPYVRFEAFIAENDLNAEICELMSYIEETQIYDINCVWEYLLASCNITDIYKKLSLNYVYSAKLTKAKEKKYTNTALLVHLYYDDLATECLDYIESLAALIDIYISTGNEITYKIVKEEIDRRGITVKELRKIENKGRDVASLLFYCKDIWYKYKYLGFIHDKKSAGVFDVLIGDKFRYCMWENLVASREYVSNILEKFKEEDKLGLVVPPIPKHNTYRSLFWSTWGVNYENMKRLAQRLQLHVSIDDKKPLIALSTSFWCRTEALKKLYQCHFDISEFDLNPFPGDGALSHAVERILPFVAQDAGFYTATVETEEFASLELVYYWGRMQEMQNVSKLVDIGMRSIVQFTPRYQRIYIYGCGKVSHEVTNVFLANRIEYEGYIVTKKEISFFYDKPVYALEEIAADENTGIIVAVGIKLKSEIETLLKDKGIDYYLWRQ